MNEIQRLTIQAAVNNFTGYGQLFCEVFAGLESMGIFCSVRAIERSEPFGAEVPVEITSHIVSCVQPEEWELMIRNPNQMPTPGKKTVYYTMWESTVLPKQWVDLLNKAEIVIVPCEWNKKGFEESGVTVPIHVIPLGYNPHVFNYLPPHTDKVFRFGIAGRVSHGPIRKGISRAIDLFQKAFPNVEDVELWVKVHPDCDIRETKDKRIKIIREHLKWHEVRKWFGQIDAFLSLSTAEGFGLWQLQAMACGRPVIAAPFSGLAEFMTENSSFYLPYREVPQSELGGGLWAETEDRDVIKTLLAVYSSRESGRDKGEEAVKQAYRFTWSHTVQKLHGLLKEVGTL